MLSAPGKSSADWKRNRQARAVRYRITRLELRAKAKEQFSEGPAGLPGLAHRRVLLSGVNNDFNLVEAGGFEPPSVSPLPLDLHV